ncbi:transcription factor cwo [Nilaparvata lugens]|uniref:transcription factor cwo n=1 Tax=Nilaparvata lugens TaxID=108931 RepID=UPI00193CBAF6|nr:transcription factor cwo [Nilaparvata lugens]
MDSPAAYWDETSNLHNNLKYERCGSGNSGPPSRVCKEEQNVYRYCETNGGNLNFTTAATSEDDEYTYHKKKISRDPMSHRIIEKRRRDRMNNCLADLSRLIPADYLKKGRGRIEKTEIIEMAIKHMKYLQAHFCSHIGASEGFTPDRRPSSPHPHCEESMSSPPTSEEPLAPPLAKPSEHYRLGFHECLTETMHFLVEVEGYYSGDALCVSLISHLQKHCDSIIKSDRLSSLNHLPPASSSTASNCGESVSTSSPSSASGVGGVEGGGGGGVTTKMAPEHHHHNGGSSSSSEAGRSGDDLHMLYENQNGGGSSQLRDILTSPNSNHSMASRLQLGVDSPTPPNNGSTSSHDSSHSNGGGSAAGFKFKNNIKQRFSAEHPHPHPNHPLADRIATITTSSSDVTKDCRSTSCTSSTTSGKRRHSVEPGSDLDAPSPQQRPYIQSTSIPIFALHSAGSFYIPLTVDLDAITPFLGNVSLETHPNLSSLVLHPVTISVNFHPPKVIFTNNAMVNHNNNSLVANGKMAASNGWNGLQPAAVNSFLPIPKWAACLPERS